MKNEAHPAAILRRAWNTHRLDVLRAIVAETIRGLGEVETGAADSPAVGTLAGRDAVGEALLTCCDELREGCGLPASRPSDSAFRTSAAEEHVDWRRSYGDALDRFRGIAGAALLTALARVPDKGPPPGDGSAVDS